MPTHGSCFRFVPELTQSQRCNKSLFLHRKYYWWNTICQLCSETRGFIPPCTHHFPEQPVYKRFCTAAGPTHAVGSTARVERDCPARPAPILAPSQPPAFLAFLQPYHRGHHHHQRSLVYIFSWPPLTRSRLLTAFQVIKPSFSKHESYPYCPNVWTVFPHSEIQKSIVSTCQHWSIRK